MVFDYAAVNTLESMVLGASIMIFAIVYFLFSRYFDKGISIIISLVIALISGWQLYQNNFYNMQGFFKFVMVVFIIFLFFKIIQAFFKYMSGTFRRRN